MRDYCFFSVALIQTRYKFDLNSTPPDYTQRKRLSSRLNERVTEDKNNRLKNLINTGLIKSVVTFKPIKT